jgi:Uma2 family endonuclease
MENVQPEKELFSVEAYFALEKDSDIRHEYMDGEIVAMAGTTLVHNLIVNNMAGLLKPVFQPRGCRVFTESVKLEVERDGTYVYPDVMVTCHKLDLQSRYMVVNPQMIVEVLSDSTASRDQIQTLKKYKKIESMQYYLLISQEECSIELYSRTPNRKYGSTRRLTK